MRLFTLSPRLSAAAAYLPSGAKLADIGCDHGRLPIYCAKNLALSRIIACDLRPVPLSHARENCALYEVEDRIELARSEDIIIGELGIELSVGVHTELEDIVGIAVRKEHGLFALCRSHEHIDGERLIAQATVDAADSSRGDRAVEMQRCSGGYTCSVGYALDLEVVVSIKVIACY